MIRPVSRDMRAVGVVTSYLLTPRGANALGLLVVSYRRRECNGHAAAWGCAHAAPTRTFMRATSTLTRLMSFDNQVRSYCGLCSRSPLPPGAGQGEGEKHQGYRFCSANFIRCAKNHAVIAALIVVSVRGDAPFTLGNVEPLSRRR
jgi:hypothetical protein